MYLFCLCTRVSINFVNYIRNLNIYVLTTRCTVIFQFMETGNWTVLKNSFTPAHNPSRVTFFISIFKLIVKFKKLPFSNIGLWKKLTESCPNIESLHIGFNYMHGDGGPTESGASLKDVMGFKTLKHFSFCSVDLEDCASFETVPVLKLKYWLLNIEILCWIMQIFRNNKDLQSLHLNGSSSCYWPFRKLGAILLLAKNLQDLRYSDWIIN